MSNLVYLLLFIFCFLFRFTIKRKVNKLRLTYIYIYIYEKFKSPFSLSGRIRPKFKIKKNSHFIMYNANSHIFAYILQTETLYINFFKYLVDSQFLFLPAILYIRRCQQRRKKVKISYPLQINTMYVYSRRATSL